MENPFEIILEKLNQIEILISDIRNSPAILERPSLSTGKQMMNVQEVAEYLSLSVPTVYGLVSRMKIPNFKRSKRLYFRKDEIDEWIGKSRRKTRAIKSILTKFKIEEK
jgi:excisionase family DNA binding protein